MSDKLEFGTRVRTGMQLVRRTARRDPKPGQTPLHKFWATEKIVDTNYPHPPRTQRDGIIIGKRTLSNGGIEYDHEAGTLFFPEEHFTAYVVAYGMNRKPFLVKKENLMILGEPEHFASLLTMSMAAGVTTVVRTPITMFSGQHPLPGTKETLRVPAEIEVQW